MSSMHRVRAQDIFLWLKSAVDPQRLPGRISYELPELITKALVEAEAAGRESMKQLVEAAKEAVNDNDLIHEDFNGKFDQLREALTAVEEGK